MFSLQQEMKKLDQQLYTERCAEMDRPSQAGFDRVTKLEVKRAVLAEKIKQKLIARLVDRVAY